MLNSERAKLIEDVIDTIRAETCISRATYRQNEGHVQTFIAVTSTGMGGKDEELVIRAGGGYFNTGRDLGPDLEITIRGDQEVHDFLDALANHFGYVMINKGSFFGGVGQDSPFAKAGEIDCAMARLNRDCDLRQHTSP